MRFRICCGSFALFLWLGALPARADERTEQGPTDQLQQAIERGVAILQKGARTYPTNRECFACHHQTLPLLGMTAARDAGVAIDDALPATVLEFVQGSFRDRIDQLKAGEGIGGKGLTVGYGLWTLKLGNSSPDDLTEAMVEYLFKLQQPDGHWSLHSIRPPAEESLVMCTVVAANGIKSFATAAQRESATVALNKTRAWLATATIDSHEDRVARLWGLSLLGGDTDEQLVAARQVLLATQHEDGGWSQTADMSPDAYATATALYVLQATDNASGGIRSGQRQEPAAASKLEGGTNRCEESAKEQAGVASAPLARGIDWLLKHQEGDGSWHVVTRAKPVQEYFDNGDPHGKDQFISIAATGWATAVLARSVPEGLSQ
ncbi:MAG: prenyltransferase/squalene oxidase repeat-containing protein [Planctomycetales bacterium]